ncbi:pollen receptor-like kinase 4 [Salvia splendens]|uniref:pollen receptor-like kinase 4 n=1 Tax=Salvia splendens TaxID=180675 RepID=UPI001100B236|nr:pollen receptor-like kinase 4 [Salvia splendens]
MARTPLTPPHAIFLFLFLLRHSSAQPELQALLKFKASITNSAAALSNWNPPIPPCTGSKANWIGLLCENGAVAALYLQRLGLEGAIDVAALAQLPNLKILSFFGNRFAGPLPNLALLRNVRAVTLSNNKMSGAIPANAFLGMTALVKLDLDDNVFSGKIPASLAGLPTLLELMLQNNMFQGGLPPFQEGKLMNFSVANNDLSGEIPPSLSHLEASAFLGNKDLCGDPLQRCPNFRLSIGTIVMMLLVVAAVLVVLVVVIVILCRRRATPRQNHDEIANAAVLVSHSAADPVSDPERGEHPATATADQPNVRMTFLREDRDVFDMMDLLKASAEILGSGLFGSTYKAALSERQIVVVKRYRHMGNVSRQDFNEHMRRLGRLSHANVVPLVAFYYRRDEKLLVYDYINKTSLAAVLHGNRSRAGRKVLHWPARLGIIKGIARGLLYLHNDLPSLTAAHGHLKSSNVILDSEQTPLLTDYGLVPIVNQEHAEQHMISYKSPEYKHTGRITKKTDVWSLGILILEILTGRFPADFLKPKKDAPDADAATWVESVAKDEPDVFDADMAAESECEAEMMKLLRIGFVCCKAEVEERPDIKEAVQQIEEVKDRQTVSI